MTEAENLIGIYQICFVVCVALAILFFALTVLFFFRFNVRKIIENRTGRAQRKSIEQMREENDKTGRLRYAQRIARGEYTSASLGNEAGKKNRGDMAADTEEGTALLEGTYREEKTEILNDATYGTETELLHDVKNGFHITKETILIHTDEWI